jgi:hypothetical protein
VFKKRTLRTAHILIFWLVAGLPVTAETSELPTIDRHGDHATLTVDAFRPLHEIATAFDISAEDPFYMFTGDMTDASLEISRLKPGTLVPKRHNIQVDFPVNPDGSPRDLRELLKSVVDAENAQSPFAYRLDTEGGFFFVPTRTRDAQGHSIDITPLLDRQVTIPHRTRKINESAWLMAQDLSKQTGLQISCCESFVAGIPWGMEPLNFEANQEPARSVLRRLGLYQWHVRCDMDVCVIDMH